jgi:hypothetical protein
MDETPSVQNVVVQGVPVSNVKLEPTQEYRLKAGKKGHYVNGEFISEGGTVRLTKAQAVAFADKFDIVNAPVVEGEDRAAGIVNREAGKVTSVEGVKTNLPGQQPAPQPDAKVASVPAAKK